MSDSFGSTKFLMTIAVLVMSYVLVFVGKLEAKTWFEFACVASGIYATGNTIGKFAQPPEK